MRFAALPILFAPLAAGCQIIAGGFDIGPAPAQGVPCYPGEVICSKGLLQSCGPGLSFLTLANCGSEAACDPSAQACRPCTPGEYACNGKDLVSCETQGWRLRQDCETPELCSVSGDRAAGACTPPVCGPGEHSCSDNDALLRCAKGRDRWELLELCAPGQCDAAAADSMVAEADAGMGSGAHCLTTCEQEGSCAGECEPGTLRCASPGLLLEHCNADGSWSPLDACGTNELCSVAEERCIPPACAVGEQRCRGQDLERCADQLTHFELVTTCADNQVCDPGQGCRPRGTCMPGSFRCNYRTLESCEGGAFQPALVCATPELCDPVAGVCVPPTCAAGMYECIDNALAQCPKSRTEWTEDVEICDQDATCVVYFDRSSTENACVPP